MVASLGHAALRGSGSPFAAVVDNDLALGAGSRHALAGFKNQLPFDLQNGRFADRKAGDFPGFAATHVNQPRVGLDIPMFPDPGTPAEKDQVLSQLGAPKVRLGDPFASDTTRPRVAGGSRRRPEASLRTPVPVPARLEWATSAMPCRVESPTLGSGEP